MSKFLDREIAGKLKFDMKKVIIFTSEYCHINTFHKTSNLIFIQVKVFVQFLVIATKNSNEQFVYTSNETNQNTFHQSSFSYS